MKFPCVPIGSVVDVVRISVDPQSVAAGTQYVGLEHISNEGELNDAAPAVASGLTSAKFIFTNNHILFGKLRPYLRKVARPDFSGICSTDIVPIAPKRELYRDYLFHFMRTDAVIARATSMASGINLPRINPRRLMEFEIPLPPLEEQRRIAAILDQADTLRRRRKYVLGRLDELARSTFEQVIGNPMCNSLGWRDDLRLGEVAEIVSGVTKGRKLSGRPTRVVPYLAVANVQDRYLMLGSVKEIEATESEIARFRLRCDDLLLTEGGDPDKLGRGALWKEELPEAIHQNHIFRVRLMSHELNPVFLNWLVGSSWGKRYFLRSAKQTTGIASINMGQLKQFPLLVPPIDVQQRFAAGIAGVERQTDLAQRSLAKLDALFASLQHRAFNGELTRSDARALESA